MGVEGPNKSPEQKKEIPLDWFIGICRKGSGLEIVGFSAIFYKLGEQKITEMGFKIEDLYKKKEELEKQYQGETEISKIPFESKLLDGVSI
jgi:hypothetical protein